jgi:NADH:ubiquinone oxidoreductase subunit 6 (subunit J)
LLYRLDRVRDGKSWIILSSVLLASSLVIQPLMSAVAGIFYAIYALIRIFVDKTELKNLAAVGVFGLIISMVYWIPVAFDERQSDLGDVSTGFLSGVTRLGVAEKHNLPTAMQIFFPKESGDIFMQQGFGVIAIILSLLALDHLLRRNPLKSIKENPWVGASVAWFIFSMTALLSGYIEVSIYPTRFWGIVAIPMAFLCAYMLADLPSKKWIPEKVRKYAIPLFLGGLILTSGIQKFQVQSKVWPTDLNARVGTDIEAYLMLQDLPANTPVYAFCTADKYPIGMDKMSYPWDVDMQALRESPIEVSPQYLHKHLSNRGVKWVLFDFGCVKRCVEEFGENEDYCSRALAQTLKDLDESIYFKMRWRGKATSIFMVS